MDRITERFSNYLGTFWEKLMEFIPDMLIILIIILSGFIAASFLNYMLQKGLKAVRFDARNPFTAAGRNSVHGAMPARISTML